MWVQVVGNIIAWGTGFGNTRVRGEICRASGNCDIQIVEKLEDVGNRVPRALIVESNFYDMERIRDFESQGVVILAGTGKISVEGRVVTVDPVRGLLWE